LLSIANAAFRVDVDRDRRHDLRLAAEKVEAKSPQDPGISRGAGSAAQSCGIA
jgi:hypothetical protein